MRDGSFSRMVFLRCLCLNFGAFLFFWRTTTFSSLENLKRCLMLSNNCELSGSVIRVANRLNSSIPKAKGKCIANAIPNVVLIITSKCLFANFLVWFTEISKQDMVIDQTEELIKAKDILLIVWKTSPRISMFKALLINKVSIIQIEKSRKAAIRKLQVLEKYF